MTDDAEREGLKVPNLSATAVCKLQEFVPIAGHSVKNPLDAFNALTNGKYFMRMMELLREEPRVDAVMYFQMLDLFMRMGVTFFMDEIVPMTIEGAKELNKPFFLILEGSVSIEGETVRREAQEKYHQSGIATFQKFVEAARVAYNLVKYWRYLRSVGRIDSGARF